MKKCAVLFAAALLACRVLYGSVFAEQISAAPPSDEQTVDLDLSAFSGTVVYAQIYQMAVHPEDYRGKVIRLTGWYDVFIDGETGLMYTVCYIPDAAACCVQGIEFVLANAPDIPDSYPAPGTEIAVTGRFETYWDGEWEYMRLADAEIVWDTEE